jgi:hypothetical protein
MAPTLGTDVIDPAAVVLEFCVTATESTRNIDRSRLEGALLAGPGDHRLEQFETDRREFVSLVSFCHVPIPELVEVIVELAGIRHVDGVKQIGKRDGVRGRKRVIRLPEGSEYVHSNLVAQNIEHGLWGDLGPVGIGLWNFHCRVVIDGAI